LGVCGAAYLLGVFAGEYLLDVDAGANSWEVRERDGVPLGVLAGA